MTNGHSPRHHFSGPHIIAHILQMTMMMTRARHDRGLEGLRHLHHMFSIYFLLNKYFLFSICSILWIQQGLVLDIFFTSKIFLFFIISFYTVIRAWIYFLYQTNKKRFQYFFLYCGYSWVILRAISFNAFHILCPT